MKTKEKYGVAIFESMPIQHRRVHNSDLYLLLAGEQGV